MDMDMDMDMDIQAIFTQLKSIGIKFTKNQRGVHAIEYAIIVSGIAMIISFIFIDDDGSAKNALTTLFETLTHRLSTII